MSQPYNRAARIPVPGKLDASFGEFWVENPWDIIQKGYNLSAFERNRVYLNVAGADGRDRDFLEVSHVSAADSDGDGRSVVAADFRNDGRMDLVVRQVGGGSLLLYENQMPSRHYLKVSLRGRPEVKGGPTSNRLGIGARLEATVGGRRQVRELYPLNSYRSQTPTFVHFGLGEASRVDRLSVRWPSGTEQVFTNLPADRHLLVTEGPSDDGALELVAPGRMLPP